MCITSVFNTEILIKKNQLRQIYDQNYPVILRCTEYSKSTHEIISRIYRKKDEFRYLDLQNRDKWWKNALFFFRFVCIAQNLQNMRKFAFRK